MISFEQPINLLYPLLTALVWRYRGWKAGGWGKPLPLYMAMYLAFACMTGTLFHWWWLLAVLLLDIMENSMNQDANDDDSFKGLAWSTFVGFCYGFIPLIALPTSHIMTWVIGGIGGGLGLLMWRLSQNWGWFKDWPRWPSDWNEPFLENNGYSELLAGLLLGIGYLIGGVI